MSEPSRCNTSGGHSCRAAQHGDDQHELDLDDRSLEVSLPSVSRRGCRPRDDQPRTIAEKRAAAAAGEFEINADWTVTWKPRR